MGHFKEVCEDHGTIKMQCRCPGGEVTKVSHGPWCPEPEVPAFAAEPELDPEPVTQADLTVEDWARDVLSLKISDDYKEYDGPLYKTCAQISVNDDYVDLFPDDLLKIMDWINRRLADVLTDG